MIQSNRARTLGALALLSATAFLLISVSGTVKADSDDDGTELKIRRGLEEAPVPLDLKGRNVRLVGLGSYIVNVQSGCNDCHSAGPMSQFVAGGNPFFGQHPTKVNPATYLGGGRNFGPLVPNSPEIVSRNLTPDKAGKTLGGDSFGEFQQTIRTGKDPDHVHPTCVTGGAGPCLPPPFDGELLQIMPWPVFAKMTTADLRAVYEYLGAVPCVEGGPGEPAGRCR